MSKPVVIKQVVDGDDVVFHLPPEFAFPDGVELVVVREEDRIVIWEKNERGHLLEHVDKYS